MDCGRNLGGALCFSSSSSLCHFPSDFLSPIPTCHIDIVSTQFAELSNFHAHITLRNLRPPGTKTRAIPRGYGFDFVSCPNYLWEFLGWTAIAVMTNSFFGTSYHVRLLLHPQNFHLFCLFLVLPSPLCHTITNTNDTATALPQRTVFSLFQVARCSFGR